jgi:hypothetical protein
MDDKTAFHPEPASTVNLAVTNATGRVQLAGTRGASKAIRVVNKGSADVFIEFGDSTVVAAVATGMIVPANQTEVFDVGLATHMAAITAASTATLYATSGVGL